MILLLFGYEKVRVNTERRGECLTQHIPRFHCSRKGPSKILKFQTVNNYDFPIIYIDILFGLLYRV